MLALHGDEFLPVYDARAFLTASHFSLFSWRCGRYQAPASGRGVGTVWTVGAALQAASQAADQQTGQLLEWLGGFLPTGQVSSGGVESVFSFGTNAGENACKVLV